MDIIKHLDELRAKDPDDFPGYLADSWSEIRQAVLERDRYKAAAMELAKALEWWQGLKTESDGVSGFHLNGEVAEWDYFDTDTTDDALAAYRAAIGDSSK